ncbi:MAG: amidase domain-containing protein, partial [Arcanobacterium sp.]|nr:amidase domain-containing protein [Arcanobacterium sp.]
MFSHSFYYFRNGDCANFISQILEAGGVKQIYFSDPAKGWWHTTGNPHFPIIGSEHRHSESWSMADTFARYMGVSFTTTNHLAFSTRVNKGSIIGLDFEKDGDWDHLGFVVDSERYKGSYGFYDYKVAQHTSNYLAWASTSINNWD